MIRLCAFADEAGESLKEQVSALKRNGITLIELRSIDGKNISKFSTFSAMRYDSILRKNGIGVFSLGSPLGKTDISTDLRKIKKQTVRLCKLARIFHTDKIRMFSFFHAENERDQVIAYLREMVAIAKKYGVILYHENEKDIYGDIAERVRDIMDSVEGLGFVYDPANYLQCGEKAEKTLSMFHAKTDYFHIKDVIASTGELVPAGYGDGEIRRLVEMIGDDKVLTVEPHLAVFSGYNQIDNTEMKNKLTFESNAEAFDCAVKSIKEILVACGYKEQGDRFIKE